MKENHNKQALEKQVLEDLYKLCPKQMAEIDYKDNPIDKLILENKLLREKVDKLTLARTRLLQQIGILINSTSSSKEEPFRPHSVEDLTDCFVEGMTQTKKVQAVATAYGVSPKTARRWMSNYHLTDLKYSPKKKLDK